MDKANNMSRIEAIVKGQPFKLAGISKNEGYHLRKIYVGNDSDSWVNQLFPGTEVVNDVKSILHDEQIDLVIMPTMQNETLRLVAEVLQTGKNIRMV